MMCDVTNLTHGFDLILSFCRLRKLLMANSMKVIATLYLKLVLMTMVNFPGKFISGLVIKQR